jgi:hypothetical protein
MNIPIDFSSTHFPIKEKYIDEETALLSRWMIFGAYPDGTVAICDSQGADVFTHVVRKRAEDIVRKRNEWVADLLVQLNGKQRAFSGWHPL